MKSFNAGTKCTLKKPNFCPDNGETLKIKGKTASDDGKDMFWRGEKKRR